MLTKKTLYKVYFQFERKRLSSDKNEETP